MNTNTDHSTRICPEKKYTPNPPKQHEGANIWGRKKKEKKTLATISSEFLAPPSGLQWHSPQFCTSTSFATYQVQSCTFRQGILQSTLLLFFYLDRKIWRTGKKNKSCVAVVEPNCSIVVAWKGVVSYCLQRETHTLRFLLTWGLTGRGKRVAHFKGDHFIRDFIKTHRLLKRSQRDCSWQVTQVAPSSIILLLGKSDMVCCAITCREEGAIFVIVGKLPLVLSRKYIIHI